MFLRACHLEANGEAASNERTKYVRFASSTFDSVELKTYKEGPTPNARRIYYGVTALKNLPFVPDTYDLESNAPLIIRIGMTDKQKQLDFLGRLTGLNRDTLIQHGAGSK